MFSTQVNVHLLIKNFYAKMLHAIGKIYSPYEAHIIVYRVKLVNWELLPTVRRKPDHLVYNSCSILFSHVHLLALLGVQSSTCTHVQSAYIHGI